MISLEILKYIKSLGFKAFIIGGAPRNILLDKEYKDIDIATSMSVENMQSYFEVIKINKAFKNATIIFEGQTYEMTCFRKDEYKKKSRFPKTQVVDSIDTDIKRRDFTINSIYLDWQNNFHYPLTSKIDLQNKILKTNIDPNLSFNQDPLRIIRGLVYANNLDLEIETLTYQAMLENKNLITTINKKRLVNELNKIDFSNKTNKNKYFLNFFGKINMNLENILDHLFKGEYYEN